MLSSITNDALYKILSPRIGYYIAKKISRADKPKEYYKDNKLIKEKGKIVNKNSPVILLKRKVLNFCILLINIDCNTIIFLLFL